jgi:UDP-N-acetylglucosamine 1-carboxyvinyltransferase
VGATENLLMAATLANGETTLTNAAKEPEVVDLAQCLKAMGANIEGIGTDRLVIQGVKSLQGATYSVLPDRIEAGTYMIAAAITGGDVLLKNCNSKQLETFVDALRKANVQVEEGDNSIRVACDLNLLKGVDVMTEPYPSFPTDLQAQFMALMTLASGASMITETIFENRFMHVPELCRMGANVTIHKSSALVRGTRQLIGAPVMATDLRASSSLVLAGLAAKGETTIHRVYHLDRGYEQLEQKLSNCGAIIRRAKEDEELAA